MSVSKSWFEPEEWVVGAIFGLAFIGALGWYSLICIPITSILWRAGGITGGNKLYRRIGVPLTISACLFFSHDISLSLALLSTVLGFGVLSMGYGIPDATDKGSWLGRLWLKLFDDVEAADISTRATIGLLFGLAYFPLFFTALAAWCVGVLILFIGFPLVEEVVP